MHRFTRLATPQYLTEINAKKQLQNWEVWGNRYAQNKTVNTRHTFQWATHEGQKVNQRLSPLLTAQTQIHCSYCDHSPPRVGDDTIDHFKPRGNAQFYHLSYQWENLYFSCNACQRSKMEQFDDLLLRPDAVDYSFERYFMLDTETFEIQPNLAAVAQDQNRAVKTINIFGFNERGQIESRRRSWQRFYGLAETDRQSEDFAYRFMFDE